MVLIVHGGAGDKIERKEERINGLVTACERGYKIIEKGGNILDAIEQAVIELEDNPLFNAGTGSVLNLKGEAEMDAAIMLDDLSCGAVAGIKNIKNPISVARKVMEETDHILLCGTGANEFAKKFGFNEYNPITEERKLLWEEAIKNKKLPKYYKKMARFFSTVGACGMDKYGRLCAGTSTGGLFLHLPGRVGDTPIIGAGTYACKFGAVSCTGIGEGIIKLCLGKTVCDMMEVVSAQVAIDYGIDLANKHDCKCGMIGVDKNGNVGYGYNTAEMLYCFIKDNKLFVPNEKI